MDGMQYVRLFAPVDKEGQQGIGEGHMEVGGGCNGPQMQRPTPFPGRSPKPGERWGPGRGTGCIQFHLEQVTPPVPQSTRGVHP